MTSEPSKEAMERAWAIARVIAAGDKMLIGVLSIQTIALAIDKAVAEERAACAHIALSYFDDDAVGRDICEEIRARTKP